MRISIGTIGISLLALLVLIVLPGCDSKPKSPPGTPDSPLPVTGELPTSRPNEGEGRITAMVEVEELTEQVANRLIDFSGAVWRRDYPTALEYLDPSFTGNPIDPLPKAEAVALPLGVSETLIDRGLPEPVDRELFLAAIESRFDRLTQIDRVYFKTRGAEFATDRTTGTIRLTVQIIGKRADGAMVAFYAWATGAVKDAGEGSWCLSRFTMERAREQVSPAPLLVEVSRAAGIAHQEPRFGDPANRSYYWRGAASEDIDGDGLYDLFVSSPTRAFVYRNRGDGRFDEIAGSLGLEDLAEVTSPLWLDIDRDGDLDLFASRVGWSNDGVPAGHSLVLRRNDGGRFVDITREAGLDLHVNAFSAVAFDHNRDGYLDLFVCCYGRLDAEYPNSWHHATNGQTNLLLQNVDGTRFEDIARVMTKSCVLA